MSSSLGGGLLAFLGRDVALEEGRATALMKDLQLDYLELKLLDQNFLCLPDAVSLLNAAADASLRSPAHGHTAIDLARASLDLLVSQSRVNASEHPPLIHLVLFTIGASRPEISLVEESLRLVKGLRGGLHGLGAAASVRERELTSRCYRT